MGDIKNIYKDIPKYLLQSIDNPNYKLHNFNIPCRGLIYAPSGSGKTNLIINLITLFCKGKGTFNNIYILTKNKDEPLYNFLDVKCKGQINIYEGIDKLPVLEDLNVKEQTLIILDDLVLEKDQRSIIDYYIRCRKFNVSIFYCSQSYFRVPKMIRLNINYLIILKLSSMRDLSLIVNDFSLNDKPIIFKMYQYATHNKFNAFIINIDEDETKKYRKNFLEYLNPKDFK